MQPIINSIVLMLLGEMSKMYRFTMIIPTYNSSLFNVLLTIGSILRQSFDDYEIIITDDGSNVDNFNEIKAYLLKNNFKKYLFIKNNQNKGTVSNLKNAYNKSKGEYIKGLGPGDLLFSKDTLEKLNQFLKVKNSNFAFGRLKSYYLENSVIKYHNYVAPLNNLIYKYENSYSALKNMIVKGNYISGSTIILKKSFILDLKYDLGDNVKYCEDIVQVLVALNGEKIDFYDSYLIWYEYGNGMSTNNKTSNKIKDDQINFYRDINVKYPNNRILKKGYKLAILNKIKNPRKKKFLRLLNNPQIVFFKIDTFFNKKNKIQLNNDIGFLIEGRDVNLL